MKPDHEYTTDEVERLPQTPTVFNQPKLVVNHHDWIQQGYHILDNCNPKTVLCHHGGIPIPVGKTLVKVDGKYDLVPEGSR